MFCSPEEKSTHYMQYAYLLLYLRRLPDGELSPLERMVRDQVRLRGACGLGWTHACTCADR